DALVAGDADAPAVAKGPGLHGAVRHRRRRYVDHAEAPLRRAPDVPVRTDQLVGRVVPEVEVVVAGGGFVEPVVVRYMDVGVADEQVGGADVGRRDGEAKDAVRPGLDVALDHRTGGGAEVLVAHDPVVR